jgi:DNA-binding response OmpR family regulator
MNTLLTAPALSPATRGAEPVTGSAVMARRQTAVQPRARILYVDDDPQLRTLGKLVLVRSGFDVDTAEDGAEAWATLNEVSYNLLITDNDMPRLTGLELIIQARRAGMRLPIVMTSGSLNPMPDLACAGSDLAVFLPKPFESNTLVETVERVLRARTICANAAAR